MARPEFEYAAKWWADLITPGGEVWGYEFGPLPSGVADLFRRTLLARFEDAEANPKEHETWTFQMRGGEPFYLFVSTDYEPDSELRAVAESCGIGPNRFPNKIRMWIEPGKVSFPDDEATFPQ